jgi:hypothetical protein
MKRLAIDNMIVDRIMDEPGLLAELQAAAVHGVLLFVTHHVLRDELAVTRDQSRRTQLLATYEALPQTSVPTHGFALDISRPDEARFGGCDSGVPIASVKTKGRGGIQDALIATTASARLTSSSLKTVTCGRRRQRRACHARCGTSPSFWRSSGQGRRTTAARRPSRRLTAVRRCSGARWA